MNVEADPLGQRLLTLHVENRTAQPLDVAWTRIAVAGPDGKSRLVRPDEDLGWVPPHATQVARLSPFTLPEYGAPAQVYDGAFFEVSVPASPDGEPTVYRLRLAAQVLPAGAPR